MTLTLAHPNVLSIPILGLNLPCILQHPYLNIQIPRRLQTPSQFHIRPPSLKSRNQQRISSSILLFFRTQHALDIASPPHHFIDPVSAQTLVGEQTTTVSAHA